MVLCFLIHQKARGQGGVLVSGRVSDTSGLVLAKATLTFFLPGDTVHTLSDQEGRFSLRIPFCASLILVVSIKGYQSARKTFSLKKGVLVLELPTIIVTPTSVELDPVTIIGSRPLRIRVDTVEYSARFFPVRAGSELEDLLKRFPGMSVDADGNVTMNGIKIIKVTVNGREFFGTDVLLAIRNLPADLIDKVQVIDDYGDKARLTGIHVGESTKILNIELKQDKRNGQFGETRLGAGSPSSLYLGSLFLNFFHEPRQVSVRANFNNTSEMAGSPADTYNQSLGINYADRIGKILEYGGFYAYTGQQSLVQNTLSQQTFQGTGQNDQSQVTKTTNSSSNHRIGFDLASYNVDSSLTLRITPIFNDQQSHSNATSQFVNAQSDSGIIKTVEGSSSNLATNSSLTTGTNFLLERVYKHSARRFSLSGGVNYTNAIQDNRSITNALTKVGADSSFSIQDLSTHGGTRTTDINFSGNYFEPIGKSAFLELGESTHWTITHTYRTTQSPDSLTGLPAVVDSLSNQYTYRLCTNTLHAGWSAQYGRFEGYVTFDGQFGLLSSMSTAKAADKQYHYFALIPNGWISWHFSKLKKLSLFYSGSSTQPTLAQLEPIPDYTNPQYPIQGNPGLHPEFTHMVSGRYDHSLTNSPSSNDYYHFSLLINASETLHKIVPNLINPTNDNTIVQETGYLNTEDFRYIKTALGVELPSFFNHTLRISLSETETTDQAISIVDSIPYKNITVSWTHSLTLQYLKSATLEVYSNVSYSSNSLHYISDSGLDSRSANLAFSCSARYYLCKHWILESKYMQVFNSWLGGGFLPNPAQLNGIVKRQVGKDNQVTLSLAGYDLLNQAKGAIQTVSQNSTSKIQTNLLGRYFLLSLSIKFERFKPTISN